MKNFIYILPLLLFGLFISACGEDEGPVTVDPAPKADFTSAIDGKQVTFTDASSDAKTYAWDFGDGNTSTEASPVNTYENNGSYVVKLTVSNDTGTDSKQEVLEIINVTIDGNFDDWTDVEVSIGASDVQGTITSVKLENLENNKLFVYVEGTTELTALTHIYLDTDNDKSTGAQIDWQWLAGGEDILLEGNLPAGDGQFGAIYPCTPCDGSMPGEWNWGAASNENVADFIVASEIVSIPGGLAYELVIDLTALGTTISSDGIGIGVNDMSDVTWGPVGSGPKLFEANDNPEGSLFSYSF